mgnify:CR=1 FL=1
MKKILLLTISFFIPNLFANTESASTLGAYGELHWETEKQKMDFHRFVVFLGHTWDDHWSFTCNWHPIAIY